MQKNFSHILKELPQEHRYRVTGSGKIVLKDDRYSEDRQDEAENNNFEDAEQGAVGRDHRQFLPRGGLRGRGRGRGRLGHPR